MRTNRLMPKCLPITMAAILLVFIPPSHALASPHDENDLQQDVVDKVVSGVTPAVVAVSFGDRFDSSGIIISKDGLVLTHCHHTKSLLESRRNTAFPRKLPVILHDGAQVEATLLATHRDSTGLIEYSLLKLSGKDEWPFAAISDDLPAAGSWCIHIGHPFGWQESRQPVPRLGRVVIANEGGIASTCLAAPGDSGGPLLNLQGEVIGIATGYGGVGERAYPTFHTNATVLRSNQLALEFQSASLEEEIHSAKVPSSLMTPPQFESHAASEVTVQILAGGEGVALGTVVDPGGLIVTKLSELQSKIEVMLPSKEIVEAQIVAESTENDIALLRIGKSGLRPMPLTSKNIERGTLVVSYTSPPGESRIGIIGDPRIRKIEVDDYELWPELKGVGELNDRRSGFLEVFVHDCAISPNECGGPLVDINGRVLGVNIARAGRNATYAIPLAIILDFVAKNRVLSNIGSEP